MTCNPADDAPYWAVTEPTMLDDVPEDVYHSGGVATPGMAPWRTVIGDIVSLPVVTTYPCCEVLA